MKRRGHICLFYFRFSSARVSHFFLCITGTFQPYSRLFSNELEHFTWWDLCSNCYFPPAGSGLSGFDTMRKAYTFSVIYVLQRLKCPHWQKKCSGISSRLLPLPTKLSTGRHSPFLSQTSEEQNQSWSLHVNTCVIFLSDPRDMTELVFVLHWGRATRAPGTLCKCVSKSNHQRVAQWCSQCCCLMSSPVTSHGTSLSTWPTCSFIMSPASEQTYPCCCFKWNVSQMAMQGPYLQRKCPMRRLFPLHSSSSTGTRCPPSPAPREQQMCSRPHCTTC